MKKIFSSFIGLVTLTVTAVFIYFVLHAWLRTPPEEVAPAKNQRIVSAIQPDIPQWQGTLDNSGYDVSFPQCRQPLPQSFVGFVIIGLNNGRPFTGNPCFRDQWAWAKTHDAAAVYINMDDRGVGSAESHGQSIGLDVLARLLDHGIAKGTPVWLDIERNNSWDSASRAVTVINATMSYLTEAGYPVGIYAAPVHWFEITYGAKVQVPIWFAIGPYPSTAAGVEAAKRACQSIGFGQEKPSIVQFVSGTGVNHLDRNIMCGNPTGLVARQN